MQIDILNPKDRTNLEKAYTWLLTHPKEQYAVLEVIESESREILVSRSTCERHLKPNL